MVVVWVSLLVTDLPACIWICTFIQLLIIRQMGGQLLLVFPLHWLIGWVTAHTHVLNCCLWVTVQDHFQRANRWSTICCWASCHWRGWWVREPRNSFPIVTSAGGYFGRVTGLIRLDYDLFFHFISFLSRRQRRRNISAPLIDWLIELIGHWIIEL